MVGTKASTDESESSSSMHSTPLLVIIEIFLLSRVVCFLRKAQRKGDLWGDFSGIS